MTDYYKISLKKKEVDKLMELAEKAGFSYASKAEAILDAIRARITAFKFMEC